MYESNTRQQQLSIGIIISVTYMLYLLCLVTNDRHGMLELLTVLNTCRVTCAIFMT